MYSFIIIDSYYFSAHSRRKENKNDDSYSHRNTLVDCGENIKVELINEEFNDKDNVEDPLYLQQNENQDNSYLGDCVTCNSSKKKLISLYMIFVKTMTMKWII